MAQQITLPEPLSELRNDEDNFAIKSQHYIRRLYETLDLNPKRARTLLNCPITVTADDAIWRLAHRNERILH
jgi:hypothetical protein